MLNGAEGGGWERKEVYFLTDLGRNTWVPDLKNADEAQYQERLSALAERASLAVVDVGQSQAENLAVTGLSPDAPFATMAREVGFAAQVRNFARSRALTTLSSFTSMAAA